MTGFEHLISLIEENLDRGLAWLTPTELEEIIREALTRFAQGSADNTTTAALLAAEELRRRAEEA